MMLCEITKRLSWCAKALLVFAFFAGSSFALASTKSLRTRIGSQTSFDVADERLASQRFYLRQSASSLMYKKSYGLSFHSQFYLGLDTQRDFRDSGEPYSLRAESLYVELQRSALRLAVGMQQVTWGETFGLPVVDIVNPIDVTEPFSSDYNANKMAVPLVSAEVIAGSFYIQGLLNPLARRSPLPDQIQGVPVKEMPDNSLGQDMEYGGRIGYLFGFGLDAKALYYRHYNRLPFFVGTLDPQRNSPVLLATESLQHSFGFAASQAFDAVVLRLDALYEVDTLEHLDNGTTPLPSARVSNRAQGAFGMDWSSEGGDVVGAQIQAAQYLHSDETKIPGAPQPDPSNGPTEPKATSSKADLWGGLRLALPFWGDRLQLDTFVLHGLGNPSWWLRPQLTARFAPRVEWITELNIMQSTAETERRSNGVLTDRRLATSSLSYRF
jgi:hypothetical protein